MKGERELHPRAGTLAGKKVVIKIGGSSIAGVERMDAFAAEVAILKGEGLRPIVVHGGGPEISEEMKRRGLPVKKVAGLRVTDEMTLEVAMDVLSAINVSIVCALKRTGLQATGMMGAEGDSVQCRKMAPARVKDEDGKDVEVDLGLVGEVTRVEPSRIIQLCESGFVPVIYPICVQGDGQLMNVNADTAAAHIAMAVKAEELVLITDVPGLMREFGKAETVIPILRTSNIAELERQGIASEGMIPKLEACQLAVEGGVKVAHMIDGKEKGSIVHQLLSGDYHGTRVVLGQE
jgi:acetylglutamate kinase